VNGKKIVGWLSRISPEAVGRAARFACRVAIRLPDEQREEPCAARSQEVERALCGVRMCRGKVKRADGTSASAKATKKNAPYGKVRQGTRERVPN
jgi:hypothetical protein